MTSVNRLMRLKERPDTADLLLRYVKGPYPMPAAPMSIGSPHADGTYKPRGWHRKLRVARKRAKLARRAQRGK